MLGVKGEGESERVRKSGLERKSERALGRRVTERGRERVSERAR